MEGQTDLYVSTLRRFVEAMGGARRIVAHFPKGTVLPNLMGALPGAFELGEVTRAKSPRPPFAKGGNVRSIIRISGLPDRSKKLAPPRLGK